MLDAKKDETGHRASSALWMHKYTLDGRKRHTEPWVGLGGSARAEGSPEESAARSLTVRKCKVAPS